MNQNLGSERFWQDMDRWATRQWVFNFLLLLAAIILLNLQGCAYFPPRYNSLDQALAGTPTSGRLNAQDAVDILYIKERSRNLQFEQEFSATISGATQSMTLTGIDGKVRNDDPYLTVTFYLAGPVTEWLGGYVVENNLPFYRFEALAVKNHLPTKPFILKPKGKLVTSLSPGLYICYFLEGSNELCRPRLVGVNMKKKFFFDDYVNWGVAYQRP